MNADSKGSGSFIISLRNKHVHINVEKMRPTAVVEYCRFCNVITLHGRLGHFNVTELSVILLVTPVIFLPQVFEKKLVWYRSSVKDTF